MKTVAMRKDNMIRHVPEDKVAKRAAEGYEIMGGGMQFPQNPKKGAGKGADTLQKPQKGAGKNAGGEKPQEGEQEGDGAIRAGRDWEGLPGEGKEKALGSKNVEELREIARARKIQGYNNMDKETLAAIILDDWTGGKQ